jgi:two-component system, cell cycle sensor histidine kinase and response regulator CckA
MKLLMATLAPAGTKSGSVSSPKPLLRLVFPYVTSLASLAIPAAVTAAVQGQPDAIQLITFAFILDITVVSWLAGFAAGLLASFATPFILLAVTAGGTAIIPPALDPVTVAIMVLISALSSRVSADRKRAESVLRSANQELDQRVKERTLELERARESLQITLASIGDAVIATGNDGRIVLLNGVAESLTGWPAREAIGRPLDEVFVIVNAETRAAVEGPVCKVLNTGKSVGLANHTILIGRYGREIPIDDAGAPIRAANGEVTGVVLTFRDISERYKAEAERQKLLDADERLVGVLTNINDGFLIVDRQWRLTFLNRKACELVRGRSEEVLGATLWETLPAIVGTAAYEELRRAMRDNVPARCAFEYEPFHAWFELGTYPSREGLAMLMRDITQNQRLEGQLRQAQKMEAVGRLAGGVAHDFNNLLTVINGYAELASQEIPTDLPLSETINEILMAGRRAAELTNGLLTFSRKQIRQPVVLQVTNTVRGTGKMLRRLVGEDIEIITALAEDLWDVEGDCCELEQIVVNLAVNARDAMPHGGILTIETCNIELDAAASQRLGVASGEYAMLAVSDTGHGMDAVTQARIFEPFFTTKGPGKGTGLGLATVYGIVTQSGGAISVYSEPARGTTFKIFFPKWKGGAPRAIAKASPAARALPRGERRTVLLVEDEESVRRLTVHMLERHGFRVLPARSGPDAIARCRAEHGVVDLVLSDMVMPQMSGEQLAAELRREYPALKFLFMSGYTEHAVVNQAMLTPGVFFVSKPFTAAVLVGKVNQAFDASEQAAG